MAKGGLVLVLRFGEHARTTRDLDLSRVDDAEEASADLLQALNLSLDDFFEFRMLDPLKESDNIRARRLTTGVRYRLDAWLAGRLFDQLVVDVGFGDPFPEVSDQILGTSLLEFAGIQTVAIPAIPLEQQVAEKLHAYTGRYGEMFESSRTKDLVDLQIICRHSSFVLSRLRSSLNRTFDHRATHALPSAIPAPPQGWDRAYRDLAQLASLNVDLDPGHQHVAQFLDPVLAGDIAGSATWDPSSATWLLP
jgi:hypothetical protein